MKVTYDKKIDVMYIYLTSKKEVITETKELNTGWIADYSDNKLVGIEILGASKVLGSRFETKAKKRILSTAVNHKIKR